MIERRGRRPTRPGDRDGGDGGGWMPLVWIAAPSLSTQLSRYNYSNIMITRQVAAFNRRRSKPLMIFPSLTLLSLLAMQTSSLLFRQVSSFPLFSLMSSSSSSSWRKTAIASRPRGSYIPQSMIPCISRRDQIPISLSRLFSQRSESVVELQYSEFIPPSPSEASHPPVM